MPTALLPKNEVIERLAEVFRRWGYDAASLSRLAQGTGLVKASLYHYFPQGKQDMAGAVLDQLGARFREQVLAPAVAAPDARSACEALASGLCEFYREGCASCLMELFTLGSAGPLFADRVKASLLALQEALATLIRRAGMAPAIADARAGEALALIQGSLVIARGTADPELFRKQMKTLANRMLAQP